MMTNDAHKNSSEFRVRLNALERSLERARQPEQDREAEQAR